jgi:hypothetical protein
MALTEDLLQRIVLFCSGHGITEPQFGAADLEGQRKILWLARRLQREAAA